MKGKNNMATITVDKANVTVKDGKVIIDMDAAQLASILNNGNTQLSAMKPGEKFMLGDEKFVVLEQADGGAKVISDKFAFENTPFGDSSNWVKSILRNDKLNDEYYKKIAKIVGADNIIPMERDLTSLDGLDDYGTCVDNISMLTAEEYRKYHKILGLKSNYPDWWWLITTVSTPSYDYARGVCCVSSNGFLNWDDCGYCSGVRPFFNLKSSIFVNRVN